MLKKIFNIFRSHLKLFKSKEKTPQKTPTYIISQSLGFHDKTRAKNLGEKPKAPKPISPPKQKKALLEWNISQFEAPVIKDKSRFHDLNLPVKIMHAIYDMGFKYCMPIQAELLPKTLTGLDAMGQAQTGTGKSAAFLITICTKLIRKPIKYKRRPGVPRVLILAPTRELVMQITKDARTIGKYTSIEMLSIFGGLDYEKQKRALSEKVVDIIIATPGRLLDFQRQKLIRLYKIEILVIDEADRMLDMGFIPDVRNIISNTPSKNNRQTLFFSATITSEVERLVDQWTQDPVNVEIEPEHVAAESIKQLVYTVTAENKFTLLLNLILSQDLKRVLVFTNRKDQTRRLEDQLREYRINCATLSGDIPQKKRIKTLENFRNGQINVLVATDVAARGLHIDDISHVINFTLPHSPEDYVHRIGRTGRAGSSGISISFACEDDSFYIPDIEKYLGTPLNSVQPDEALLKLPPISKKSSSGHTGYHSKKRTKAAHSRRRSQTQMTSNKKRR